jgi:hypothetical protein
VSGRVRIEASALGGTVLVAACVPRVPATIVVDETRRPAHERRSDEPARPKPPSGPDRTPPQVVRAELVGGTRVRIHFSEAVVSNDSFNPSDFRISYLRVYVNQAQSSYSVAYYYDVAYMNYGSPAVASQARMRGTKLEIDFAPEISPWFCQQLEYNYQYDQPGTDTEAGLFLHYAAGSIPIRDEAGNSMIDFGAEWVALGREQPPQTRMQLSGQAAVKAGSGLVRVACGPPIPPGPR